VCYIKQMRRVGKGRAPCALVLAAIGIAGCGGVVETGNSDGGTPSISADGGNVATPSPATCPAGGPAGASPLLLGPPPGGTEDLWRGLDDGAGEGEAFTTPRAGVIDRVVVQIFADPGVTACRTRIYRWCNGRRVLVFTTDTPASSFPVYIIDADPGDNIWDQDLRTTTIPVDPPVPVAAGEEVDAVFSAVGAHPYTEQLVSVITMDDIAPNAHAVFPDGSPGIGVYEEDDWDYHAQIDLR
jgi:hypothetical protein